MTNRKHEAIAELCREHPGVWFLFAMNSPDHKVPSYMPRTEFEFKFEGCQFDDTGRRVHDTWVRYTDSPQDVAKKSPRWRTGSTNNGATTVTLKTVGSQEGSGFAGAPSLRSERH